MGVARPCEADECVGDLGAQFTRPRTTSGHGIASVGVEEGEWNIGAMEGARATVQNGRAPPEDIEIGGGETAPARSHRIVSWGQRNFTFRLTPTVSGRGPASKVAPFAAVGPR